jgi:hypothetical protein
MKRFLFALFVGIVPLTSSAGAIAQQYAAGFEGVLWGDSLAELVAKHAGGDHFFAFGGGHRVYIVADEKPMFGISRRRMQVSYFFDEAESVVSVEVGFPYDQRMKLLGFLTLSFGPYQRTYTQGISTIYQWASDDGTGISVQETSDPSYGMLRFGISGPNSLLLKTASDCAKQIKPRKEKK